MTQAIICHDAGGAEILSSYALQHKQDYIFVLEGPAKAIFKNKLGNIHTLSLNQAIKTASSFLCGTGWQSSLEYNAICQARSHGVHSIAFLDHWIHYSERFTRSEKQCLPDEIWVGDTIAEHKAKVSFPEISIKIIDNPYFQDIKNKLATMGTQININSDHNTVLYVCEPLREFALMQHNDEYYWGYSEEDALKYFLSNTDYISKNISSIQIRPHPSESANKYENILHGCELPVTNGGLNSLIEEINNNDIIVGSESMAMVIGLLANKRVISCIPPGGRSCQLPHTEIEHLQNIVKHSL